MQFPCDIGSPSLDKDEIFLKRSQQSCKSEITENPTDKSISKLSLRNVDILSQNRERKCVNECIIGFPYQKYWKLGFPVISI